MSSRVTPFVQVDAFTRQAFSGNPAGVVVLEQSVDDGWRQDVAAEINVAETAFLEPLGGPRYRLRWFTPTTEVALCGHATLAAAHALWSEHGVMVPELVFETASGRLTASRDAARIVLDLPAIGSSRRDVPDWLGEVLPGVIVEELVQADNEMWIAVLPEAASVRSVEPDLVRLAGVAGDGLIVTASAGPEDDVAIVSRYFAPHIGIPEDPVTGAAHCALAPLWAPRLGRDTMLARQASPRGGRLDVRLVGDRVELRGHAVTILRGEILA